MRLNKVVMASGARNMIRKIIQVADAPKALGPYSQAVVVDQKMYLSGCIGLDPTTANLVAGGIGPETEQALKNMGAILHGAGLDYGHVVKVTVLLSDIADWGTVNNIYQKYFTSRFPARTAYAVNGLPKGAKVEIEAIAVVGDIVEQD